MKAFVLPAILLLFGLSTTAPVWAKSFESVLTQDKVNSQSSRECWGVDGEATEIRRICFDPAKSDSSTEMFLKDNYPQYRVISEQVESGSGDPKKTGDGKIVRFYTENQTKPFGEFKKNRQKNKLVFSGIVTDSIHPSSNADKISLLHEIDSATQLANFSLYDSKGRLLAKLSQLNSKKNSPWKLTATSRTSAQRFSVVALGFFGIRYSLASFLPVVMLDSEGRPASFWATAIGIPAAIVAAAAVSYYKFFAPRSDHDSQQNKKTQDKDDATGAQPTTHGSAGGATAASLPATDKKIPAAATGQKLTVATALASETPTDFNGGSPRRSIENQPIGTDLDRRSPPRLAQSQPDDEKAERRTPKAELYSASLLRNATEVELPRDDARGSQDSNDESQQKPVETAEDTERQSSSTEVLSDHLSDEFVIDASRIVNDPVLEHPGPGWIEAQISFLSEFDSSQIQFFANKAFFNLSTRELILSIQQPFKAKTSANEFHFNGWSKEFSNGHLSGSVSHSYSNSAEPGSVITSVVKNVSVGFLPLFSKRAGLATDSFEISVGSSLLKFALNVEDSNLFFPENAGLSLATLSDEKAEEDNSILPPAPRGFGAASFSSTSSSDEKTAENNDFPSQAPRDLSAIENRLRSIPGERIPVQSEGYIMPRTQSDGYLPPLSATEIDAVIEEFPNPSAREDFPIVYRARFDVNSHVLTIQAHVDPAIHYGLNEFEFQRGAELPSDSNKFGKGIVLRGVLNHIVTGQPAVFGDELASVKTDIDIIRKVSLHADLSRLQGTKGEIGIAIVAGQRVIFIVLPETR